MKTKIVSALTALALTCAAMPAGALPVSAQEETKSIGAALIVLAVSGSSYAVYQSGETYYLPAEQIESVLGRKAELGELLACTSGELSLWHDTELAYKTNQARIMPENCTLTGVGFIQEMGEPAAYEVKSIDPKGRYIDISAGEVPFLSYQIDWTNAGTESAGDFNWSEVEKGDTISFYTWQGAPAYPISLAPYLAGDANHSGDVDILDVIAVNKYLLSCKTLSDRAVSAIDLNGDGEVNSVDALHLLKYVAGIESSVKF